MAKKFKLFSEIVLGVASALTIGFAMTISPAHACTGGEITGYDKDGNPVVTNCADENLPILTSTETEEDLEEVDEKVYSEAGGEVNSRRRISHSYFLAGNQVLSNDEVAGFAAFAGNSVQFTGSSEYAAIAGNSIVISGEIDKDLFVAANAVEITEEANVGRDIFGFGNTVLIKANLHGSVFISGNRLVLENVTIDGDLNVGFDEIVIKGRSSVAGTFKYNDSAVISGLDELATGATETYSGSKNRNITFAATITDKIIFLLARLLATIILVSICIKFSKRLLSEFEAVNAWKDLALGLGLIIVIPLAAVFVMVTIIGLPLGIIGLAFYALFAYLSTSVTGGVIGEVLAKKVFKKEKLHILLKFTVGIVLIELLGMIPYAGSLITAIAVCFGFGYLIHKLFRQPAVKTKK